jgi:translation initiation factor IF-3
MLRRALREAAARWAPRAAPRAAPPPAWLPPPAWPPALAPGACSAAQRAAALHTSAARAAGPPRPPASAAAAKARTAAEAARAAPDPLGRLVNGDVTARTVRLVAPDGTHSVLRRAEALAAARAAGLDLVQVDGAAVPPVCRLLDWDRFRYEERQREKDGRRKAVERRRGDVTKEVRLSLRTAEHDLRVKAAQAARALEEGHRAKCVVLFKAGGGGGRASDAADPAARAHATALLEALRVAVQDEAGGEAAPQLAKVDAPPKMEGATMMWMRLAPAQPASAAAREKRPRDAAAGGAGAPAAQQSGRQRKPPREPPAGARRELPLGMTVVVVTTTATAAV